MMTESLVTLGNSLELPVLFKRLGWRIVSATFARKAKLPMRIKYLGTYWNHIRRLTRIYGPKYVVLYLKASQLALQKHLAGTPLTSLKELMPGYPVKRLDRRGLPLVIPMGDRRLIQAGSASIIRY